MERYKSKLKDFRVAAGLTQQELADETGVAVRTIALIETKEGSNPSVGTLKRLLAYFKITFEELFPRKLQGCSIRYGMECNMMHLKIS